jgi:hypothetical protein
MNQVYTKTFGKGLPADAMNAMDTTERGTSMSTLQPYIAALAKRTGLALAVSPDGSFTALLDGKRLFIQALDNSNALLFYMEVGRPTHCRRGNVLASLMGGNLFLAETRGAALSYDPFNEMVGLNLILSLRHLEGEEFINAVDNIVAAAEEWGHTLETLNAEAEELTRQADGDKTEPAVPDPSRMIRI